MVKEVTEIKAVGLEFCFDCGWDDEKGSGQQELIAAREQCGMWSGDVDWTIKIGTDRWIAIAFGKDVCIGSVCGSVASKVKRFYDYLRANGWPPAEV